MIEIKFYYRNALGKWYQAFKCFNNPYTALRFIRKCNASPKMLYSGEFTCDDPLDMEIINRANI